MNTTYSTAVIGSNSTLTRQWYLDVHVNDTLGNNLQNANVTAWDTDGVEFFSVLTDSNGDIVRQNVTEYVENSSGKTYKTNYTVNATKTGYSSDSQQVNLTTNKEIVLTLQDLPPLWQNPGTNDTDNVIPVNGSINLTAQGYDETALDFAILETNETGTWNNKTVYGSPMDMNDASAQWVWSNFTWKNTSITTDKIIGWRIYYNDTYGNENVTNINTFDIDTTLPTITIESPKNITYPNSTIWFNVTLSEAGSWCGYDIGAGNITMSNDSSTHFYHLNSSVPDSSYNVKFYCNDSVGNMGSNSTVWFTVSTIEMQITKSLSPDLVVARENETINVTTTVKLNKSSNNVYQINITDEVPYDFSAPQAANVKVYNVEYQPYAVTDITDNVTINVVNPGGGQNQKIQVNITNMSQTDADYLEENDSIRIIYLMNSSQMEPDTNRTVNTNATAVDVNENSKKAGKTTTIYAAKVVIRGWKTVWTPDLSNPQNISVKITLQALGGPVSGILLADYLPEGATIYSKNVTYYNNTNDVTNQLYNGTDYYLGQPGKGTLPDGSYADIYHYNFSYQYSNWDGNLYDKDNITIYYNTSVLGGGQWVLPAIISGFDPTYQKHIKTEMYPTANIPLFDIELDILTKIVKPGNMVKAMLRMMNVGGPRAKVDVAISYSIKDEKDKVVTKAGSTVAVAKEKEKDLELFLPKKAKSGTYSFEAFVTYTGREAVAFKPFTVEEEEKPSIPYLWIMIIIVVFAFVLGFELRRSRK